jgi:hypothetical protein
MKSQVWGPTIWYLIHSVAYGIEDDEYFLQHRDYYFKFYNSLKKIIPCPICRSHFHKLMKKRDINNCKTKTDLIYWTIEKHNKVNKNLGKKQFSIKESNNKYEKIELKNIIKGLDIITYNNQRNLPINSYKMFFESLRVIFPIKSIRHLYEKGMKKNKIKVSNHHTLIQWYINLGRYIIKNIK